MSRPLLQLWASVPNVQTGYLSPRTGNRRRVLFHTNDFGGASRDKVEPSWFPSVRSPLGLNSTPLGS